VDMDICMDIQGKPLDIDMDLGINVKFHIHGKPIFGWDVKMSQIAALLYCASQVNLNCGIRQGGVLSPYLFAVLIDSVVDKIKASGLGCYIKFVCYSILLMTSYCCLRHYRRFRNSFSL